MLVNILDGRFLSLELDLNLVYSRIFDLLFNILRKYGNDVALAKHNTTRRMDIVMKLLFEMATHQHTLIFNYFKEKPALQLLTNLLKLKPQPLTLEVLQFLKLLITMADPDLNNQLLKNCAFELILKLWENNQRDNALVSRIKHLLFATSRGTNIMLAFYLEQSYGRYFQHVKFPNKIVQHIAAPVRAHNSFEAISSGGQ